MLTKTAFSGPQLREREVGRAILVGPATAEPRGEPTRPDLQRALQDPGGVGRLHGWVCCAVSGPDRAREGTVSSLRGRGACGRSWYRSRASAFLDSRLGLPPCPAARALPRR